MKESSDPAFIGIPKIDAPLNKRTNTINDTIRTKSNPHYPLRKKVMIV